MFFSVKFDDRLKLTRELIVESAYDYISCYELRGNDLKLDKYLTDAYGVGLKSACAYLVEHCDCNFSGNTAIIHFLENKLDNLASLITYGNGVIKGSRILRKAFSLDTKGEK